MKTIAILLLGLFISNTVLAVPFTYQGKLDENGSPASGSYDFRFRLLDASDSTNANQVAIDFIDNLQVSNGIFAAEVDFSILFNGTPYWIEVGIRPGNSTGTYTVLTPNHPITTTPEAQVALGVVANSISTTSIANGTLTLADTDGSFQQRVAGICNPGSSIRAIAADGTVTCQSDSNTTYSAGAGLTLTGDTFAVDSASLQLRVAGNCTAGSAIRAIAADGTVTCESTGGNYSAGNGLTLSGSTFAADTGVLQARVSGSCTSGNHIRAIAADGTVTCEADKDTTYTAGAGLTLTGTTFAVDSTSLQSRVGGSCAAGSSIRAIAADGTVTCETDDDTDTTYTAGAGLTLTGTTFAVDSASLQSRVSGSCAAGSAISSIDSTGAVTCEPDNDTTYSAGSGLVLDNATRTFSIDSSQVQPLITDACPAGSSIRQISGTTVVCETDDGASYTAGTGLTLTGTTFAADTSTLQARVGGSCAAGSAIRSIAADGTVTCETDDSASYTAGTGLTLTGTTFAADTNTLQVRVSGSCAVGSSIRSIAANGTATCENHVVVAGTGFESLKTKGYNNTASGDYSTVMGGIRNTASGSESAVMGGNRNTASGPQSTVMGGFRNTASGEASIVAGGWSNTASGYASIVAGGNYNLAGGEYSFAAGWQAVVRDGDTASTYYSGDSNGDEGTFIWADSTNSNFVSTGPDQFLVRASGGVWLGSNSTVSFPTGSFLATSTGAYLSGGGTWTNSSDENRKENFQPVDGEALLNTLATLPIQRWNYKAEDDAVLHIGPTAQAFRAAFGLGHDETHIATVDADGVALAGVQALIQRLNRERERNTLQAERIRQLATRVAEQQTQLATLQQQQDEIAQLKAQLSELLARELPAREAGERAETAR